MQALGAGEVEIGFVDGGHFDAGREAVQDVEDLVREIAVTVHVAFDEDGLRAEAGGGAERHGGVDAEFSSGVGGGRDDAALVGLAAYDDGFAFEGRVEEFFDGDEEGVHIYMADDSLHGYF
jgi:hypothetical protein